MPTWVNRLKVQFLAQKITKIKFSPISSKISKIQIEYKIVDGQMS